MAQIYARIAAVMGMTETVWDRHANPWSGWTRALTGPVLILAIYSRQWLGWWALLPIALLLAWNWLNPRAFPPPRDHDDWMARGVLGERWLIAAPSRLPAHHRRATGILTALSAVGVPPLVYGLWVFDPGWTVAGAALALYPKFWFIDRMNWIVQDTTGSVPGTPLTRPQLPAEAR